MKTKIIVIAVLLVALLLAALPVTAEPPPLPSSFYGQVRVNGADVLNGTVVSAWINGAQYAYATTSTYADWGSVYSLDVPGDQLATTDVIEGGRLGDVIVFKVGDATADQTGIWQSGTNVRLDLSAVATEPVPTPVPTRTPMPTQTPIPTLAPTPTPRPTATPKPTWCRWFPFLRICR